MKRLIVILALILVFSVSIPTFSISNLNCTYKPEKNRYVCSVISSTKPIMACTPVAVTIDFKTVYRCVIKEGNLGS